MKMTFLVKPRVTCADFQERLVFVRGLLVSLAVHSPFPEDRRRFFSSLIEEEGAIYVQNPTKKSDVWV